MKKTIIALLALAGVAAAEVGSKTYTWVTAGDDTTESPSVGASAAVMAGTVFENKVTTATGNYGYLSAYSIHETGTFTLYNAITSALTSISPTQTEATALTLNFSFAFGSTSSNTETQLIQIGQQGNGIGLALYKGGVYLTLGDTRSTKLGDVNVSVNNDNGNRLNEVAITFANGGYTGTINKEGSNDAFTTTSFSGVLKSTDVTWNASTPSENAKYSIGMRAPGWTGENLGSNAVLLKSASATVSTYAVPEPTTATLSLLALAGLAARRRRR
ncbi:MAG: PEP-CTERM sorting domain-containing protein [Akkermansia sp.]|nr:PEP-CTERM sorting domain-containing protein [Akkermansia sp.]